MEVHIYHPGWTGSLVLFRDAVLIAVILPAYYALPRLELRRIVTILLLIFHHTD